MHEHTFTHTHIANTHNTRTHTHTHTLQRAWEEEDEEEESAAAKEERIAEAASRGSEHTPSQQPRGRVICTVGVLPILPVVACPGSISRLCSTGRAVRALRGLRDCMTVELGLQWQLCSAVYTLSLFTVAQKYLYLHVSHVAHSCFSSLTCSPAPCCSRLLD
eukprot:scaffold90387_cov21-Tisochrysis_lutea.AAC.2